MTPYIKKLIMTKNKLYRQNKLEEWRQQTNIIRHQINKRKKTYYGRLENRGSKLWWSIVNETRSTGKNKTKQDSTTTIPEQHLSYCSSQWSDEEHQDITQYIETATEQKFIIRRSTVLMN
jgi:hypothetical protein